ncbi:unnamed protein product [Coffea canephora]|uniref:Uncharacterized protein n=1 Tax=Coffea canephora TaxID=49390 RepID=A0A068US36_COFCA|nr:unnamed protein product [Coffea canephora]
MSDSGGGAEARARSKQYEYGANSSLILTSESRHPRDAQEPSGEPESLRGKIDPRTFGDRVFRDEESKKKERESLASEANSGRESKKRRIVHEESVFTLIDEGVYQPKSRETRAAYEAMLSFIQQQLGGQPVNVVRGAADEILAVLKNDNLKNHDKKKEMEKFLSNPIPNQVFDHVVSIGRLITDYRDAAAGGDDGLDDDDVGVAVEFEENEEVDNGCVYDLVQEDEEEEDDGVYVNNCTNGAGAMWMGRGIDDDDDEMQDARDEEMALNVRDIDAYWLQRKISEAYGDQIDAQQCQKLAEEILEILTEVYVAEPAEDSLVHSFGKG